jgi:type VI secretion system secreted protein Hcp
MKFAFSRQSPVAFLGALVLSALALAAPARGQGQMFLKVGDIRGASLDSRHAGESEISSWSWGFGRSVNRLAGGAVSVSAPLMTSVTISKRMDRATPELMTACASAQRMNRAIITMRSGADRVVEFCRVVLEDVTVVNVTEAAGSDGPPTETLQLNFSRVGIEYISIVSGAPGPVSDFGWDLRTAALAGLSFPPVIPAYDKDSDGDGMPDWWEIEFGLDPLTPDGGADADQDGATNLEEFLAGTNPKIATQVFRARLSFLAGDRTATLTWPSAVGRQYNIFSADSIEAPFQNFTTVPAVGDTTSISVPATLAKRFFRVQAAPAP